MSCSTELECLQNIEYRLELMHESINSYGESSNSYYSSSGDLLGQIYSYTGSTASNTSSILSLNSTMSTNIANISSNVSTVVTNTGNIVVNTDEISTNTSGGGSGGSVDVTGIETRLDSLQSLTTQNTQTLAPLQSQVAVVGFFGLTLVVSGVIMYYLYKLLANIFYF